MEVILYSTGCPSCKVLATKLNKKNIKYTINSDIDEMKQLGMLSAPNLSVDGEIMTFTEAIKWVNAQVGE